MDIDKSFKNWIADEVERTFGIRRTKRSPLLDRWLAARPEISEFYRQSVENLRQDAEDNIDAWNEAALKFFFIGPIVSLVDFNEEDFHGFLEQTLYLETDKGIARGNVDFLVAAGRAVPVSPYYLLHEYKPERTTVMDPQGQLLIAMLAARLANEEAGLTQPIYGSYVIGRLWFFVILNGNEYTISRAFDCTLPDGVEAIFRALLEVKVYISALFAEL